MVKCQEKKREKKVQNKEENAKKANMVNSPLINLPSWLEAGETP